ncbi:MULTISPECIES: OsmC family peroxiredoxin [Cobetia]|uniref:OsmC family protein n=1 Tax=Cobetia TaxID=204286 RepID=UPI00159D6AF4|nr:MULTISPECIES: OsmC family peroxiredoxin [unclassified Cobetia]MCO7231780.1 OsmC family protein [Cobetia sp. Dlab-2-AX]MCO7234904.1 OsmC family protein [Cobetia sp. Dlab-2-U]NVN55453.1 OsmC family protein [bacterium Scap17]
MTIKKTGSAHWEGSVKQGKGTVSSESGALKDQPYGFNTRFEDGAGTNPEELIGAAHASCFSMALSMMLGEAGHEPKAIDTTATVHLDKEDSGFSVTKIALVTKADVPGISEADFQSTAEKAKGGCPISKLFTAEISLEASLVN